MQSCNNMDMHHPYFYNYFIVYNFNMSFPGFLLIGTLTSLVVTQNCHCENYGT